MTAAPRRGTTGRRAPAAHAARPKAKRPATKRPKATRPETRRAKAARSKAARSKAKPPKATPSTGPRSKAKPSGRPAPVRGKAPAHRAPTTRSRPDGPSRRVRQARLPVALAVVVAITVVGTSFPLTTLLAQHRQLAATSAQLATVQRQNSLLAEQERQLNDKTEIQRLARSDYQLVYPGQSLFNVLPAAGTAGPSPSGTPSTGDPADQPLVPPADAPDMAPDPGNADPGSSAGTGGGHHTSTPSSGSGGFWHRVLTTLEFWR